MATDREIITQLLSTMANEIKSRVRRVSGSTADSIEVVTGENFGQILAAEHIGALEFGRKPTSGTGISKGESLRERILQWIKDGGMGGSIAALKEKEQIGLSWAVSNIIHQKGTKLWRAGGNSGVITESFSETRLTEIAQAFAGRYQVIISSQVFDRYSSDTSFRL